MGNGVVGVASLVAVLGAAPQLTRPPQLVVPVTPVYPQEAWSQGVGGAVDLQIDIDARGEVHRVELVSSPESSLAASALVAATRLQFSPAEVDNAPAPVRIQYTFHFETPKTAVLVARLKHWPYTPPVTLQVDGRKTSFDERGDATIELPAPATYRVGLRAQDQDVQVEYVSLRPGQRKVFVFELAPQKDVAKPETPVFETVVRSRVARSWNRRLEKEELEAVPGVFGDPVRTIETLPGVGRAPFASGILVLRGSSPDESTVYVDDHEAPLLYHFGAGRSVLPPSSIASIDVAAGGFGPRFGRATGGIIALESSAGRDDFVGGEVHVDLLDAGGFIEGPVGNLGSFRVSGRQSYLDALIPFIQRQLGTIGEVGVVPRYYDYHGRIDLHATNRLTVGVIAYGSSDTLVVTDDRESSLLPASFNITAGVHRVNPFLNLQLDDSTTLRVSPAATWLRSTGDSLFSLGALSTQQLALRSELRSEQERGAVRVGVDMVRNQHRYTAGLPSLGRGRDFPAPGGTSSEQTDVPGRLTAGHVAAYAEMDVRAGGVRISPGIRLEHAMLPTRAQTYFDPRLDVAWEVAPWLRFKGNVGTYHRLPDPHQVSTETGNPELPLETSTQAATGFWMQLPFRAELDVEVYGKQMADLAQGTNQVRVRDNQLEPVRYLPHGEGRAYGVEVLLKKQLARGFLGWIAYGVSRAERRVRDGDWSLYGRDQTHNLSVVASLDLPGQLKLGARFRYVSGYPWTPVSGAQLDADTGRYQPQRNGEDTRLPSFIQVDFRAEKTFGQSPHAQFVVYLDVQNATNHTNVELVQYSHDFDEQYQFPGLPIVPSLGVAARF